jgi:hypothetical protein
MNVTAERNEERFIDEVMIQHNSIADSSPRPDIHGIRWHVLYPGAQPPDVDVDGL